MIFMFSKKLKILRKKRGITQQELADAINISRSTIAGYEIEDKQPSYEVIAKIAKYFSVSTDFLLGIDDSEIIIPEKLSESKDNYFFFFFDNLLKDVFMTRLNTALSDKKLTINDLSGITTIDIERCAAYLNGECEPSLEDLISISHALEVTIDYLLGQTPKVTYYENKILSPFIKLNKDNKDIVIGKAKDLLREQEHEESVAAEGSPLKKASGK